MSIGGLVRFSLGAGIVGSALYSSMFVVDAGHRAIVFNRSGGFSNRVREEGINFIIPALQWPVFYEIRTRPAEYATETGSKDLQTVGITLRILFRPEPSKILDIHQQLGPDYENVFTSIANEVLKSVVAQYDAGELITQRESVSAKVREELTSRAANFNLLLDDVSIKHVSFSQEYTTAIESKQVAQQEAERSRFLVLKAEQEKQAAIIRASGEAEAAKLIIESLKSGPGFIELRKIEAMKEIADNLSKSRSVIWLPNGVNMLLTQPQGGPSGNANTTQTNSQPQYQYQNPSNTQTLPPNIQKMKDEAERQQYNSKNRG